MIDLEGLVRNIDLTPTDSIIAKKPSETSAVQPATGEDASSDEAESIEATESPLKATVAAAVPASKVAAPVVPPEEADSDETLHAEALDPAKLDEILNIEDPEMAAQVDAIRAAGFKKGEADVAIDDEAGDAPNPLAKLSVREQIRFKLLRIATAARLTKSFAVRSVKDSKGLLRELLGGAKIGLVSQVHNAKAGVAGKMSWLKSRSSSQKFALVASAVIVALLLFVGAKTIQGTLLPNVERAWIANFADHADGKFTYEIKGGFEDFNDPLLHPEFVILVERIVVNLSRTQNASDSANPMAAFELYLQTDTQDAAVEIKDRSVEIRDAVSRSVERMTYPDLADEDGKAKLKLLIRKDLNQILTRGKVRRVFFKTIVLNPES